MANAKLAVFADLGTWDLRLHRPRDVDGGSPSLHAEFLLPVLDHLELDGDDAGDFDGAAE
jgi:hypothetical protein